MRVFPFAVAVVAFAGVASAQWSDNFNRPDGPLGPDWNVLSGSWAINSNQGTHTSAGVNEIIQHANASLGYASSISSLDVFAPGSANQFSALMIGLGGTSAIMVKIQDQDAVNPGFSHIGIYSQSGASWGAWAGTGTGFAPLTAPFTSGRLTVYFSDANTLVAEIDTDFNGTPDQTYTKDGVAAIAGGFGTGFGIGAWGATAVFDNFNVVPAPGTLALLGLGGLLAGRRRR